MTPSFIAIDMDGVVANFSYGVELLARDPGLAHRMDSERRNPQAKEEVLTGEHWSRIHAAGEDWWANLPSLHERFPDLPTARELYDWATGLVGIDSVAFVTAIGGRTAPAAAAGKIRWLRRELQDPEFSQVVITKAAFKAHLSHTGAFLIDDSPRNCSEWRRIGGKAFQYDARMIQAFSCTQPWNKVLEMAMGVRS